MAGLRPRFSHNFKGLVMDDNDVSITALGGNPFSASITSMGFDATGSGSLPGAGSLPDASGVINGGSSVVIMSAPFDGSSGASSNAPRHGSNPASIPGTPANFMAQVAASVAAASAQEAFQFTAAGQHTPTRYVQPWWKASSPGSDHYQTMPMQHPQGPRADPLFSIAPPETNDFNGSDLPSEYENGSDNQITNIGANIGGGGGPNGGFNGAVGQMRDYYLGNRNLGVAPNLFFGQFNEPGVFSWSDIGNSPSNDREIQLSIIGNIGGDFMGFDATPGASIGSGGAAEFDFSMFE